MHTFVVFPGLLVEVRVGRPQSYVPPPAGELPALDLQPIRDSGLLPACEEDPALRAFRSLGSGFRFWA